jgi:hypothetical protein
VKQALPENLLGNVTITVEWELPRIIKRLNRSGSGFTTHEWDPATHVVLLVDDTSTGFATATTCLEYISKTWGDHCSFMIKQLVDYKELILTSSHPYHDGELFNSTEVASDPGLTTMSHPSIRDTRDLQWEHQPNYPRRRLHPLRIARQKRAGTCLGHCRSMALACSSSTEADRNAKIFGFKYRIHSHQLSY